MPKCSKIRRKKRQVCLGDLDKQIQLQDRDITPPVFGSADFDEKFTNTDLVWAAIQTVNGKTFFDNVGVETNITHIIYIRYDAAVTSETWVLFDLRRFDILDTENLEERDEFLKLTCVDRGLATLAATKI